MERSLWFDGQDVKEEDVDNIEATKVAAILRRGFDTAVQTGIMNGLEVTNPVAFTLRVAVGVAYDSNGEAIIVNTPTDIVVAAPDVGDLLVIQYAFVDGTSVNHPITGVLSPTRRTDSFTLAMVLTPAATDVVLAELVSLDGGGTAVLDVLEDPLGPRVYWSARIAQGQITDTMLDPAGIVAHAAILGTGVVTGDNPHGLSPTDIGFVADTTPQLHQEQNHSDGIEPQSAATMGLVTVNAAAAPDQLNLVQMIAGDSFIIDGLRIDDTVGFSPTVLDFAGGTLNPALYTVHHNVLGAVSASLRATYGGAQNITGTQLVDVSDNHGVGVFTLIWDDTADTLQWDSGPTVQVEAFADLRTRIYRIHRGGGDEDQWIEVFVDFSLMVGSNQSDNITVLSDPVTAVELPLAKAYWSGSATGFLGYGVIGGSGTAKDKRRFGNLGRIHVDDIFYDDEYARPKRELEGNVLSYGGALSDGGGLNLDVAFSAGYINGERFSLGSDIAVLADNTADQFVYIDDSLALVVSTTDPYVEFLDAGASDTDKFINKNNFILLGRATTLAGVITEVVSDLSALAFRTDSPTRLLETVAFNIRKPTEAEVPRKTYPVITSAGGAFDRGRVLIWESPSTGSGKMRKYLSNDKDLLHFVELTVNAQWDAVTKLWTADNDAFGASLVITGGGGQGLAIGGRWHSKASTVAPWLESAWDQASETGLQSDATGVRLNGTLGLKLQCTTGDLELRAISAFGDALLRAGNDVEVKADAPTNPAVTVAHTNQLIAASMPKAYGIITQDDTTPTLDDGFNAASVAIFSVIQLKVTLASSMANTDYTVMLTGPKTTVLNDNWWPAAQIVDSSSFIIHGLASNSAGNGAELRNLNAAALNGGRIHFVVFGKQT